MYTRSGIAASVRPRAREATRTKFSLKDICFYFVVAVSRKNKSVFASAKSSLKSSLPEWRVKEKCFCQNSVPCLPAYVTV